MVHALKEAMRVLVHDGILMDIRPVTAPLDLEVLVGDQWVGACGLDVSPGAADDEAVGRAVRSSIQSRVLALEAQESFLSSTYWDSAAEFLAQLRETGFRRFVAPGDDALVKIEELMNQGGRGGRLRLQDPMTIDRYRRCDRKP